jgi:hypothetical protein
LKKETKSNDTFILITFKRLASELSMDSVLCRPWSDEVEDYTEYKRLRRMYREKQNGTRRPLLKLPGDGTLEPCEDEAICIPNQLLAEHGKVE